MRKKGMWVRESFLEFSLQCIFRVDRSTEDVGRYCCSHPKHEGYEEPLCDAVVCPRLLQSLPKKQGKR